MILPSTGAQRPSSFDDFGLRRTLFDRALPLVLAAVACLAVLALAGWFASAALIRRWQEGMGATLTVQVPQPGAVASPGNGTRLAAVLVLLAATPGMASAHALSDRDTSDLLEPWIGKRTERLASAIPAVIGVRLIKATESQKALSHRLSTTAPGNLLQDHSLWAPRLSMPARDPQTCVGGAVVLVGVATMMPLVIRAGLSARRQTIEIVHGLGATDGYIAVRATRLAAAGAGLGALAGLPVLLVLALVQLTRPFGERQAISGSMSGDALQDAVAGLPMALWYALPCLPLVGAAAISLGTAQASVRHWLRRLP